MTALDIYAKLEAEARYLDGRGGAPLEVIVNFGERSLIITDFHDVPLAHWPLASLRAMDDDDGAVEIAPDTLSTERIVLSDPAMVDAISQVCPNLRAAPETLPEPRKSGRKLARGAGLLGLIVVLGGMFAFQLGDVTRLIPPARAVALGEAMAPEVRLRLGSAAGAGARVCDEPEGVAALRRLTARITPDAPLVVPFRVKVLDHPAIGAIGLPGGQVLVLRGLIEAAASPEDVAGILAHEIGHLKERDALRAILAAAGPRQLLGLLIGDPDSGVAGSAADALVRVIHPAETERTADATANALLDKAALPATAHARFMAGLDHAGSHPGVVAYAAGHPDPGGRTALALASDGVGADPFAPALEDRAWIALRNICDR